MVLVVLCLTWLVQDGIESAHGDAVFTVDPSRIALDAVPEWAPLGWTAELEALLEQIRPFSLHDEDSLAAVRERIAGLPWVAEVALPVRSFPRTVAFEVRARRPAAVALHLGGVWPLDAHGVLLPGGGTGMPLAEFQGLPALAGGRVPFLARPRDGVQWQDGRLLDGIEVVGLLSGLVSERRLLLEAVDVSEASRQSSPDHPGLVVRCRRSGDGGPVDLLWGRSDRRQAFGERSGAAKVRSLEEVLAGDPGLRGIVSVDLRFDRAVVERS